MIVRENSIKNNRPINIEDEDEWMGYHARLHCENNDLKISRQLIVNF